ncbi:MAG: amino acid permease, partial [Pseudomonadota bacterium]
VIGLFVLRARQPDLERPFRVPLFPVVPLIYLSLTAWTLLYVVIERPAEVAVRAALILTGGIVYLASKPSSTMP